MSTRIRPAAARHFSLLSDGALGITAAADRVEHVTRWMPRSAVRVEAPAPASDPVARIRVFRGRPRSDPPHAGRRTFRLFGVGAWVAEDAGSIALHGAGSGAHGQIELAEARATLRIPAGARVGPGGDAWAMLTLSSALLLGRLRRALAHAAAVVSPSGGAWLLVGDARAGKTTTTLNLARAGWGWLSDDQVVLAGAHDSDGHDAGTDAPTRLTVEGWPRTFHVDEGWEAGDPVGRRRDLDPESVAPGQRRVRAPVKGLLFPAVHPERATGMERVGGGDALALLLRQSPWLLLDRARAPALLALLGSAARLPSYRIRLGLDTYRDAGRLRRVVEAGA